MNILVTGGTGFTGAALVLRLLDLGHKVTSIDYQKGIRYDELGKKGAKLIQGSITNAELVENVSKGVDIVFHLAAAFRELDVSNEHYYDVNVNGTKNVMESAKTHGVKKVVYCSTQGVHGHVESPPGDENTPIKPEDYYQETKYGGELVVQEYISKGVNSTIIRPTAIYGPGDPERFFMIFKRVSKGFFPMFGNGKTFYHPVYIDNLIDAFMLCMQEDKGNGQVYLIADEEYVEIRQLVKKVARALSVQTTILHFPMLPLVIAGHICEKVCRPFKISPPIFPRRVDWFRQVRAFKIDKARRELGYQPMVGLDEGLSRTARWYQEGGYL